MIGHENSFFWIVLYIKRTWKAQENYGIFIGLSNKSPGEKVHVDDVITVPFAGFSGHLIIL